MCKHFFYSQGLVFVRLFADAWKNYMIPCRKLKISQIAKHSNNHDAFEVRFKFYRANEFETVFVTFLKILKCHLHSLFDALQSPIKLWDDIKIQNWLKWYSSNVKQKWTISADLRMKNELSQLFNANPINI